jgi:DNA repair protein RadC
MSTIWSPLRGRRALVMGDVSLGLIRHVAGRYEDVVVLNTKFRPPTQVADLSTLLNARHAELEHPPFPWDPGYFDGLFTLNFLFPSINWPDWLKEGLRVLKPRGRVMLIEPIPIFDRASGSTQKMIKLWKNIISELPPNLAEKFIDPEKINDILKGCDIHHLRLHTSLDILGADAHDWLPSPWVRDAFLNSFLPTIEQTGIDQAVRDLIKDLSQAFIKRSAMDLPVRVISGVKRKIAVQPFSLKESEEAEVDLEKERVSESSAEAQEDSLEGDSWKVIWTHGPESITDIGLLSVILTDDEASAQILKACKLMLGQYGSVALARETLPKKLVDEFGLDRRQAIRLVAAFELGRRFLSPVRQQEFVLNNSDDVFKYLQDMGELKKEHLRGLYLDARGNLLLDEVLALGSLTTSTVHGRDVFLPALKCYASAIILAHNHPSGDPEPSPEDVLLTKKVREVGQVLGIELVDHIVVAGSSYVSMSDKKLI